MTPDLTTRLRGAIARFDPVALPIVLAGLVLLGAVLWLLGRPLPRVADPGPDLAAGLAAQAERADALAARLAALEGRAPPDLAPLEARLRDVLARADAARQEAEATARELAARPNLDPATLATRASLAEATARLEAAQAALGQDAATRLESATAALRQDVAARLDAASREAQAGLAEALRRAGAIEQSLGGFAGRIAANETGLAARTQAIETQSVRIAALEQQTGARLAALDAALAQRAEAIAAQQARLASVEQQTAARLAALEATTQRLAAVEARAARLAALDALRAAVAEGRPLGAALAAFPDAPAELARFAAAAPPTEAALRLGFEEAARAARAASEPAREGQGVVDNALARLSGLVTIRRGEEVLFGDAAAAEIERARRALDAGDLDLCLRHLARLSPPAREAMAGWLGQAEQLRAARAALRQLAAG
jgi:hypothetical protein